jgi:hypothetical protein
LIIFIENQIFQKRHLKNLIFVTIISLHIGVQQPKSLVTEIGLVIDLTYGDRTLSQLAHGLR